MAVSQSLRMAIPCGINVCPPFHSISESIRPPSLLAPAKNVLEDETRRNTFWLGECCEQLEENFRLLMHRCVLRDVIAYALERTHACGNGWAMMLDDQDISQLLPVRREDYEKGVCRSLLSFDHSTHLASLLLITQTLIPPSERQWSHDVNLLTHHPPGQTDSFILFVKATILLSRVKQFNLRFRSKYHARDPSVLPTPDALGNLPPKPAGIVIDARESPAFKELDVLSSTFRQGFPPHLRNPVDGNSVDAHLYSACLTPYL